MDTRSHRAPRLLFSSKKEVPRDPGKGGSKADEALDITYLETPV